METVGGNHSTTQENPVFGNPHFRIFQRQVCLCSILLHSIYCVRCHHTIQIVLQVTSSIHNSPRAVMPSLHHLNLPVAFVVHPQPILLIPGKILSTPATCDPFFYFTNPNHCAVFCDLHSQSKSGKLNNPIARMWQSSVYLPPYWCIFFSSTHF